MAAETRELGTLFTADIRDFMAKTAKVRAEVAKFYAEQSKLTAGTQALKRQQDELSRSIQSVSAATRNASGALGSMTSAQREHGKQLQHIKSGWESVKGAMRVTASYGIAATAIFGVVNALKAGVVEIANFDQALKNLQAVTQATNAEVAQASEISRKIATETRYSATEVAQGMVLLGQSGLTAAESIQAIGAVSTLATGTLETFDKTADLLTTTLVSFNMRATESSRVSDVMANAINKSKLTVEKLRVVFGYVGASAHQAGLTLEQLAASTMVLANNGLRASTTATGLRQVLARLLSPGTKLREAFKEYNIELEKVNPSIAGFENAIKNLAPVLVDHATGTIDMAKAYEMFGLRGAQAAAILVQAFQSGNFQQALETLYEVGAAEAMAAKQKEGLAIQAKNLADRMRNLAISLGDAGVLGALSALVRSLSAVVDGLDRFVRSVQGEVLVQMALWTAAIAGTTFALTKLLGLLKASYMTGMIAGAVDMVYAFKALSASCGTVSAAFGVLGGVMLNHPIITFSVVVAGLLTTLKYLYGETDRNIKKTQESAEKFAQAADSAGSYRDQIQGLAERWGKGEEVGREFDALLTRLKQTHPELSREIDLNKDSYEDLLRVMDRFERTSVEESIRKQVQLMELQHQKLMQLKEDFESYGAADYGSWLIGGKPKVYGLDEFAKSSQEGARALENLRTTAASVARSIFDMYERKDIPEMESTAQSFVAGLGLDPEKTKFILDEIGANLEAFSKRVKVEVVDLDEEVKNNLAKMPDGFQEVFDSLPPLDQTKFALGLKSLYSQISQIEKTLKSAGQSQEQIDAGIQARKKQFLEEFRNANEANLDLLQLEKQFQSKMAGLETNEAARINQKEQAALDDAQVWHERRKAAAIEHGQDTAGIDAQYQQLQKQIATSAARERLDLEQDLSRRRLDIKKQEAEILLEQERAAVARDGGDVSQDDIRAKQLQAAVESSRDIMAVEERNLARTRALYGEHTRETLAAMSQMLSAKKAHEADVAALENHNAKVRIDTAKDEGMAKLKAAKKFSDEWLAVLQDMYANGLIQEQQYADAMRRYQEHLDKEEIDRLKAKLKSVAKYSEAWLDILKQIYALEGLSVEQFTQKVNDAYKQMFENIEKGWRDGSVSASEYAAAVKAAVLHQVLTEEAANEKRVAANGSAWERISLGVEKAKRGSEKWGELVISTSERAAGAIADNMTNSLFDFVDGTKSAKEAVVDFARDTLNWLAKIIVRWQLFNLVAGMMPKAPTSESFTSSVIRGGSAALLSAWGVVGMHGGGAVGSDHSFIRRVDPSVFALAPRLHSGLAYDEFPAILQRGEEVLSRRDVAAGRNAPAVNITVNNTAPGTQARVDDSGDGLDFNIIVEQVESAISGRMQRGAGMARFFDSMYRRAR
jgi:TP901 family phage tail tape measure protein